MKSEITKRIENYISGEMSEQDKNAFENDLNTNTAFRNEFELHKQIHLASERAVIRQEVKSIGKSYHFIKKIKITIAVVLFLSALFYTLNFISDVKKKKENFPDLAQVKKLVQELSQTGELLVKKGAAEFFYWEGNDSVFLSKKGVLISIPSNTFLLNGNLFKDKVIIKWEEALDASTIMKNGLNTITNGKLLETQGMIGISACTQEGEKLKINPKVGIYIQVPVDEYKSGMKLFKGITDGEGVINWVNPKPLQKALVPVAMNLLNFYPMGFESKLDELKLPTSKNYRDSLYLSFDDTWNEQMNSEEESIVPFEQLDGENLFKNNCSECHTVFKKQTGPDLYNIRSIWTKGGAKDSSIYKWVNNWQAAVKSDSYANSRASHSKSSMKHFPELSHDEIDAIFDFIDSSPINFSKRPQNWIGGTGKLKESDEKRDNTKWDDKIKWTFSVKYDGKGQATLISKATLIEGWYLFSKDNKPKNMKYFGYPTKIRYRGSTDFTEIDKIQEVLEPTLINHQKGKFLGFKNVAVFTQKIKINKKDLFYIKGRYTFQICNESMNIFPPNQQFTLKIKGNKVSIEDTITGNKIPPSKVLAFWKPEFNNTLLSTREFERRMKEIHAIGDVRLLEIYTSNLTASMESLDQKAVDLGYTQFQQFVDEHVGALNLKSAHLKGLKKFYKNTINEFKNALIKNNSLKNKIEKEWKKKIKNARSAENARIQKANEQAVKEEFNFNLAIIAKQMGLDERKVKHLGKSVGFKVEVFGNYNIDAIVLESVNERKTIEVNDEKSHKTIKIEYSKLHLTVKNENQFELLFAYLLPHNLNSYERLKGKSGKFEYPLNNEINYDVAIVGINDKGFFYKELNNINSKENLEVDLDNISEIELDKKINQMNNKRGVKSPMSISEEIEWLVLEQKNYQVEKRRKEDKAFREVLYRIVFPSIFK